MLRELLLSIQNLTGYYGYRGCWLSIPNKTFFWIASRQDLKKTVVLERDLIQFAPQSEHFITDMVVELPKDVSYLYERLFSKLSDEGFYDVWSIGGFLVLFLFCTIAITLILAVAFSFCCSWCFELPVIKSSLDVLMSAKSKDISSPELSVPGIIEVEAGKESPPVEEEAKSDEKVAQKDRRSKVMSKFTAGNIKRKSRRLSKLTQRNPTL